MGWGGSVFCISSIKFLIIVETMDHRNQMTIKWDLQIRELKNAHMIKYYQDLTKGKSEGKSCFASNCDQSITNMDLKGFFGL